VIGAQGGVLSQTREGGGNFSFREVSTVGSEGCINGEVGDRFKIRDGVVVVVRGFIEWGRTVVEAVVSLDNDSIR